MRAWGAITLTVAVSACSLLAPSEAEVSGAYGEAPGDGGGEASLSCGPGTKVCDGRCVSVASPATGCAAESCMPCAYAHGEPICVNGACALGPCENRWSNCNGLPDDGCEVDTSNASQYCGSCGRSCAGSTPLCSDGECVPRCHAVRLTSTSARATFPEVGMDLGTGDFTVEAWFERHADFVSTGELVFGTNADHPVQSVALIASVANSKVECNVNGPVTLDEQPLTGALANDTSWHHVACVRQGQQKSLFIDGKRVATNESHVALVSQSMAIVGRAGAAEAAALVLGPMRVSSVARYTADFSPRWYFKVESTTVAQYLVTRGFDGTSLVDEAGGDDNGTSEGGIVANDQDVPCN